MLRRARCIHDAWAGALTAAALVCLCATPAAGGQAHLGGEGPLLPRLSGPRSSPTFIPPADETTAASDRSDVLEATGTEDEREAAAPEEVTSTLRLFLDEMLTQSTILDVLPPHMGVEARRTYLEDRGIRTYREGIIRFPDSTYVPQAHLKVASIYARRGDREAALRECAKLLERFPTHELADEARLERARLMFEIGEYAGARDEAYLLIDSFPDRPLVADAYMIAARSHERLGEHDDGQTAYEHVLRRTAPGDELFDEAREGLASIELARGNTSAAVEIYKQLIAESPSHAVRDEREYRLAQVYVDAGETGRARALLRRIVDGYELNAYRATAAYQLADSYYGEGRIPQAAKYYRRALVDFPNYPARIPALFRAAEAYRRLGLYSKALDMVRLVAKARDPEPTPGQQARAKLMAGEILLCDGKYSVALEELYGALLGEVSQSERDLAAYRIAQCYYRSGYYNEALEAFDAALEQAPAHPLAVEAKERLADCYEKKGWLDDARRHYTAIVEAASEDDTAEQQAVRSRAAFRLLNTYSDLGLYSDELSCARRLLEGHYAFLDEARLLYRMARATERLNNPAQAAALYSEVRSRFPATAWAEQADVKIRHMQMLKQIKDLSETDMFKEARE